MILTSSISCNKSSRRLLSPRSVRFVGALLLAIMVPSLFAHAQLVPAHALVKESNGLHLEISALRDDILRFRYWRGEQAPEDESWAVLPAVRQRSVAISLNSSGSSFATADLQVKVDSKSLEVRVADKAGNLLQQDAAPVTFSGKGFTLSEKMPQEAHYFGLGDKAGAFDRREGSFTLWNTDAYAWQESTDPLYKAVPFFMTYESGHAFGTLLDNTWRTHFDFGREEPNVLRMGAAGGPIDIYFLYGPSPKQVLAAYAWLTGPTPLPPMWSLGFQQSRFSYTPQSRVEEVANRLRSDSIPADAIYLDIDYQDRYRPFTINTKTFPDMAGLVQKLHSQNLRVVAITDLHIAKAPDQGYAPYDEGTAQDRFVHNPNGSVYSGKVWPGASVFPDFTQQQTRAWWGTLYRDFTKLGFDGFWNDMNEPSVFMTANKTMPEDVVHRIDEPGFQKRTATHAEIHNVFGMENARATAEGQLKLRPDERPFVLTRAAYAGTQRYAATWTGDNSATWNHLRMTTFMLKNLGLSGFSMAGADVGGYAGTPSPELLTKWTEIAAFQPIDRNHAENGTNPHEVWANGPAQEAIRRRFIEERYRLMPYLYTVAEEMSRDGVPILRPLFLEFPDAFPDKHPMDIDPDSANEFLFGPDLLIAPPKNLEQTAAYSVRFPGPGWYDYWTGARVQDETAAAVKAGLQPEGSANDRVAALQVTPTLQDLPVFVRPGSILPYAPLTQSTQEKPSGPLTLKVFPGPDCHGDLYLDDGHTFAYRTGNSLRMEFACSASSDGSLAVHIGPHQGSFSPWWSALAVQVYGWQSKAVGVTGGDVQFPSTMTGGTVSFTVPDTGRGIEVLLRP